MECQAEIFKRKVIQLLFEMDGDFGGSGDHITFPDGSTAMRYNLLDDFNAPDVGEEIHPPFTIECQYKTVREYVTE